MGSQEKASQISVVIFGITGDLARRKLLPALSQLKKTGNLPGNFQIIGLSRRPLSTVKALPGGCKSLAPITTTLQLDPNVQADYQKLKTKLKGADQIIFYLAVPPDAVTPIVRNLGHSRLNTKKSKLLLEKPFGVDLASARELIAQINKYFTEPQVYRIDHYLAKEAAQNIAVFLGSNAVFREVWNRQFVDYVEIVASETIGIENRAEFWEATGTLRDFVQSHLLQLAALTLMRPCDDFDSVDSLQKLRLSALKRLKASADLAVRGQYSGYRAEVGNAGSATETFAAVSLYSSDPRWKGVPVYLATGKRLSEKLTEIRVQFKPVSAARANRLVLRIQPKEGIEFDLWVKQPGHRRMLNKTALSFHYGHYFKRLPEAYEQVLVDVIGSNHSLFASSAEVLASWQILEPILQKWSKGADDLIIYKKGAKIEQILNSA